MTFGNRFGRGLVAAMEDEALAADLAEVDTGSDSAEAAVAEVSEISGDIGAASAEIESASADADALDTIVEKVEATEESGGLTPEAAEVVEVAVETIYARMGITRKPIPALEGFSDAKSRVRTTHIAVEDWKEQIKKIWQAIVNAFAKVVDWIKSFFAGIFDSSAKLAKRANALLVTAKDAKGEAKAKEIPAGGFVAKLATKDGFAADKAIAGIQTLATAAGGWVTVINAGVINWKELVSNKEAFDKSTPAMKFGEKIEKDAGEGFEWQGVYNMLGNKTLAVLVPTEAKAGEEGFKALKSLRAEVSTTNSKLTLKEENVPTLTIAQIKSVAESVLASAKVLNGEKSKVAKIEADLKNFVQDAKSISQLDPKDEGISSRSKTISGAATAVTNAKVKCLSLAFAAVLSGSQAGLDYAEKSMKQYSSDDKK